MSSHRTALVIGTLDTKGTEIAHVQGLLENQGFDVILLDAGVRADPSSPPDVTAREVASAGGVDLDELRARGDRGTALEVMARGAARLAKDLHGDGRFGGVIAAGGSCGTAIATAAMRELPVGLPKVMVSTMASGQVAPYVGVSDITMVYSVVDVAGLNRVLRLILGNAVGALVGMMRAADASRDAAGAAHPSAGVRSGGGSQDRPLVAATMFGVTTPCVERVRSRLEEAGFEVLVFHATGSGGRAMEGLIDAGFIAGVADVTTTEWCDELVGGVLSAGPTRLEAAARAGIPQVVSCGALDMVNFGARETVPARFSDRLFHVHNPAVTLMRTSAEECRRLGEIISEKVNGATGPTTVVLPLGGVSALDAPGQPFHDPLADRELFESLRAGLRPDIPVVESEHHINDPEFADRIAATLIESMARTD